MYLLGQAQAVTCVRVSTGGTWHRWDANGATTSYGAAEATPTVATNDRELRYATSEARLPWHCASTHETRQPKRKKRRWQATGVCNRGMAVARTLTESDTTSGRSTCHTHKPPSVSPTARLSPCWLKRVHVTRCPGFTVAVRPTRHADGTQSASPTQQRNEPHKAAGLRTWWQCLEVPSHAAVAVGSPQGHHATDATGRKERQRWVWVKPNRVLETT